MVKTYAKGRGLEYDVIHDLKAKGFETMRAASSAGAMKIDVLAVRPGRGYHVDEGNMADCVCHSDVLTIQAKFSANIGSVEWNTLLEWSRIIVATPIMAQRGPRGTKVVYTELLLPRKFGERLRPDQYRPYVFRVNSRHDFPHA